MRLEKERVWRVRSYKRYKKMEVQVSFFLIRLLILHPHILHLFYLHILPPENRLYSTAPTHPLYYIIALDSRSKVRYVYNFSLKIRALYHLFLWHSCLLLSMACLA